MVEQYEKNSFDPLSSFSQRGSSSAVIIDASPGLDFASFSLNDPSIDLPGFAKSLQPCLSD